ncbi:CocE/NonD family hydrolase [Kineococcus gynurae]|uniref:CocE/NonD family hydrolase n=1 Tax=Kineococcus gynurae TaxID=452979 RepID=A0ABV5LVD6_9ACTN
MRDGTRLSADVWLPVDATENPVPALLEYLPYRKGDRTAVRDAQRHPWYAGHGYASVRVDLRGSGDSEGVMLDEYAEIELADGEEVIAWLAAQAWCSGSVGMFGISWGGFNSLQLAARRPPALKAIVTVCSSDDRYNDDVHYFGGALLSIDMLAWAVTMLAFTARPPDPDRWGPAWRELWETRLDALEPFLDIWLDHQERDAYWRRGSVGEDYPAIEAAVLAVGGWADPYRTTVLRLLENFPGPVRGIVGPWPHQYPDIESPPGPAIGFLQESLRWWDRWLKGIENGVEAEPALRSWMQESVPPATGYVEHPGRWLGEPSWPSPNVEGRRIPLTRWRTAAPVDADGEILVHSPLHTGIDAGRYFPYGNVADLPPDQREEDGRSVTFDLDVTDRLEILGVPVLHLAVRADAAANLAVRVCDVAPDGSSTLVTRGVLNLLKRDGMDRTSPVTPGELMTVAVPLQAIAWAFPPGHRVRVAVSTSYFPWVWPSREDPPVRLVVADGAVELPVRTPASPEPGVGFAPAEQAEPLPVTVTPGGTGPERRVTVEPQDGRWTLQVDPNYAAALHFPDGLTYQENALETYTVRDGDPGSAEAASSWRVRMEREGWTVEFEATGRLTATATHFVTEHTLLARCDGEVVRDRSWRREILRTST